MPSKVLLKIVLKIVLNAIQNSIQKSMKELKNKQCGLKISKKIKNRKIKEGFKFAGKQFLKG